MTEQLLKEALDFANSYVNILEKGKNIINHARKSLLFKKQLTWIKKESRLFDVLNGRIRRSKICELVGNFLLYALSLKYNKKAHYTGMKNWQFLEILVSRIVRQLKRNFKDFSDSTA